MVRDPKQFLLLHVEKVVFVVILILLTLVIGVYRPWSIDVPEKASIRRALDECRVRMTSPSWDKLPAVPDYVGRAKGAYERPWPEDNPPALLPPQKLVFFNVKRSGWVPQAPTPPPVVPVKAVYAKADKGQVVVVFNVDDQAERRALETTAVPEYQEGLDFDCIEIWRLDKSSGEKVLITPARWLPSGLPRRYGAPPGWIGEEPGPHTMFGEPVYLFAQVGRPGPRDDDERRRMEEEMKRRMEEDIRRQRELEQRLEEERRRMEEQSPVTPKTTPGPRRVTKPSVLVKPGPKTISSEKGPPYASQGGWYHFIDRNVDPDARYEYSVVIHCRNPIFGAKKQYETSSVPPMVSSRPVGTGTSLPPVAVESFKKWWFQGGTASEQLEMGTFKVRCLVGGRRDINDEDISRIVTECNTAAQGGEGAGLKKPTEKAEPEGVWIEQNFTVRPGEEIGAKSAMTVNGEKRDVDFGTGCFLVSVWNDVQVTEDRRTAMVPGKEGTPETVERVNRVVHPQKLRMAYVDRKGRMKTRWQEMAPPISKTSTAE
jgi:hypothetical protein